MKALVQFTVEKKSLAELGMIWQGKDKVVKMLRHACLCMYETGRAQQIVIKNAIKFHESRNRQMATSLVIAYSPTEVKNLLGPVPQIVLFDEEGQVAQGVFHDQI